MGYERRGNTTKRRRFLAEIDRVIPWTRLLELVEPKTHPVSGRKALSACTMLRFHFMQQWSALSAPGMEEALHDAPAMGAFAGLDVGEGPR